MPPAVLLSLPEHLLSQVLGLTNPRNCMAAGQVNRKLRQLGLEAIVERAADPEALCAAAAASCSSAVRALLEAKADPTVCGASYMLPLHHAAKHGNLDMARLLLDGMRTTADTDLSPILNTQCSIGRTALFMAAEFGHPDVLRLLLDAGADADCTDMFGATALKEAVQCGHADTARLLLRKGAGPDKHFPGVESALAAAADRGDLNAACLLLAAGAQVDGRVDDGQPCTPLYAAAKRDHIQMARLLIERGADKNMTAVADDEFPGDGESPLYTAASQGYVGIVSLLLDEGANVNTANANDGATALHGAAKCGHVAVVELLLSHGALVNVVQPWYNATPLLWAAAHGHVEAVELLVQHCAHVDAALRLAQGDEGEDAIEWLYEEGLRECEDGFTALHLAAARGCVGMAEVLIEAGANLGLLSVTGATVLDVAERCKHTAVASLLRGEMEIR